MKGVLVPCLLDAFRQGIQSWAQSLTTKAVRLCFFGALKAPSYVAREKQSVATKIIAHALLFDLKA
jgi:hypothetical protein